MRTRLIISVAFENSRGERAERFPILVYISIAAFHLSSPFSPFWHPVHFPPFFILCNISSLLPANHLLHFLLSGTNGHAPNGLSCVPEDTVPAGRRGWLLLPAQDLRDCPEGVAEGAGVAA